MKIDFETEVKALITELKPADSYLDCENVIIAHIKKHIRKGTAIPEIESYLNKLVIYFEDKMVNNKDNAGYVNNRYVLGFLHTITTTPYWYSWIKKDS